MKGKFLKCMGIFMASLVVMQGVLTEGYKASAAHSATGAYGGSNGITYIIEDGTGKLSPCFCIEASVGCGFDGKSDTLTIDSEKAVILNTIFLLGFNMKDISSTSMTSSQTMQHSQTQQAIWSVTDGYVGDSFAAMEQNKNHRDELIKKTAYFVTNPSYVDGAEKELVWNESTNQFELTLTNTVVGDGISANSYVKVDTTSLPSGVQVVVDGENLKLTSTEEFTTAKAITLYKRVEEKGKLVVWDFGSKQDQITLDYDEPSFAKTMQLNIKTGVKPVVATPEPTVAPTQEPTEKPVVEEQAPLEDKQEVEIKDADTLKEVEAQELEEQLDDVPKTADNSNLEMVWSLLGAAFVTLVGSVMMNQYDKKKKYN